MHLPPTILRRAATVLATAALASAVPAMLSAQSAVPTIEYSHGDPSSEEQYLLELINRARANPKEEGVRLANTTDPNVIQAYTYYNTDRSKLQSDFAAYPVRPPLAFNSKLLAAARKHSEDMKAQDFQNHMGTDGLDPQGRMSEAGYTTTLWDPTSQNENIYAYSRSLRHAHESFASDVAEPQLNHRRNIMNFGSMIFTEAGISVVRDDNAATEVGPLIVTEEFGRSSDIFLTGVVYRDANGNGFYDVGEGVKGVTVMPSTGSHFAVTSRSGGYAIPVTGLTGTLTVTFSGGTVPQPVVREIALTGSNVKLDLIPLVVGQAVLAAPADKNVVESDTVRFSWRSAGVSGARYRLDVSESSDFSSTVFSDENLADTTFMLTSLKDKTTYYWRVRAAKGSTWGEYSPTWSFTMKIPARVPQAAIPLYPPDNFATMLDSVHFAWQAPEPGIDRYWFELAGDAAMGSIVRLDSTLTAPALVVSDLEAGKTYYWRVRSHNAAGWGAYSSIRSFTTATSSVAETIVEEKVMLAPNPVRDGGMITIALREGASVSLTIHDARGEKVATLHEGYAGAGEHAYAWSTDGIASGVYLCVVNIGTGVHVQRVIVQK